MSPQRGGGARARTKTGSGTSRRKGDAASKRRSGAERLGAAAVRWHCAPVSASKRRPSPSVLLGQPRPMRALTTGLELYAPGYNIFLSGLLGSGRTRIVRALLEELRPLCRIAPDRVYVHNFREPNCPRLLELPRGRGTEFRIAVGELVDELRHALRVTLSSRHHRGTRKLVTRAADERQNKLFGALERECARGHCALVRFKNEDEITADIYPLHDGEPIAPDDFEQLAADGTIDAARAAEVRRSRSDLLDRLADVSDRIRQLVHEVQLDVAAMDRKAAAKVVARRFELFRKPWSGIESLDEWVSGAQRSVLDELPRWIEDDGTRLRDDDLHDREIMDHRRRRVRARRFPELGVHLVREAHDDGCPVVVELNPTYHNLFGTIEPAHGDDSIRLDQIHTGSLLRADGGYLILRAGDVMNEPGLWNQLQRALKSGRVEIREYDPHAQTTGGGLQPEAIPIDLKVVMIGEPGLYEALVQEDPQFAALFKVHAEFDSTIANSATARRRYADFLAWLASGEQLAAFGPTANAAMCEHGARLAGRQDRLSTCFGELADIAREASFLARRDGAAVIEAEQVEQALIDREYRNDRVRETLEREIVDGYLRLRTSGRRVGEVNALTVLETGAVTFGKPVRVTATCGVASDGKSDVLSIEREAEMSGPLHDKGVMILHGFLLQHFGRERAVAFDATVCFEQLYTGLDGDSASCAELFALLSSIARIPLDQGLAITGSMNQMGEVQAVGGVNEKVEGFFRACKQKRLTGKQGVILPRANASDLMLDPELVAAVEKERFHVWVVDEVWDAFELLSGLDRERATARIGAAIDGLSASGSRDDDPR